jgi:hypothetical protein
MELASGLRSKEVLCPTLQFGAACRSQSLNAEVSGVVHQVTPRLSSRDLWQHLVRPTEGSARKERAAGRLR